MNAIKNSVRLIGYVGQDPEVNSLEDGKKFARFSLATNEQYTTAAGEKVEKTYWHHVVFWNRVAQVVEEHVRKGTKVAIEGKLTSRSWEDEAGVRHYRSEIAGHGLHLL